MARTILEVFVSSTGEDLSDHRDAAHAHIQEVEYFRCVSQRTLGAHNAKTVALCRKKARQADLFVGLIGMRRGWEPTDTRSITEIEHDSARADRRFVWVTPEDFPIPGNKHEGTAKYNRQRAFRRRLMEGSKRIVSQKGFASAELLAAEIALQLTVYVTSGELIKIVRPDLMAKRGTFEDPRPAVAAAFEQLARDKDIDLATRHTKPGTLKPARLEDKLAARAKAHESRASRGNDRRAAAAYWRHVGALAFLHDTKKALAAYQKATTLDRNDAIAWCHLGELQHRVGELDLAETAFRRLLAIGEGRGDLQTQSMGHLRLGWISFDRGDYADAERSVQRARRLAERAHWGEGIARAYGNLGNIHFRRGNLKQAEQMHGRALKLEQGLGNAAELARTYGNLGAVYRRKGALKKAEAMQRKALKINEEIGSDDGMARAYASLGNIHSERRDLAGALAHHRKALALYRKLGSTPNIAITHGNLGLVHFKRRDFAAAKAAMREALRLFKTIDQTEGLARTHRDLAAACEQTNDRTGMRRHLRAAADLFGKAGKDADAAEMARLLAVADTHDRPPPARRRARRRRGAVRPKRRRVGR